MTTPLKRVPPRSTVPGRTVFTGHCRRQSRLGVRTGWAESGHRGNRRRRRSADRADAQNIAAILEAAGSSLSQVARCGVFLVDIADFQKMNGVYARMFGDHRPARTTVQVAALPEPRLLVEIDAVALIP